MKRISGLRMHIICFCLSHCQLVTVLAYVYHVALSPKLLHIYINSLKLELNFENKTTFIFLAIA